MACRRDAASCRQPTDASDSRGCPAAGFRPRPNASRGSTSHTTTCAPGGCLRHRRRPRRSQLPVPPSRAEARDALETRIGSRWLLYIGVVAIIVGVSYFEKLAIDNHWLSETARVIQGAIVGMASGRRGASFRARRLPGLRPGCSGCGVAILYVSTYAAFNFYQLIGQPVAFILMSGVTMLAAWLANRQRSQGLALVAVGGGFATPFLLPGTTDAEVALFGYETILIAGHDVPLPPARLADAERRQLRLHGSDGRGVGRAILRARRNTFLPSCS